MQCFSVSIKDIGTLNPKRDTREIFSDIANELMLDWEERFRLTHRPIYAEAMNARIGEMQYVISMENANGNNKKVIDQLRKFINAYTAASMTRSVIMFDSRNDRFYPLKVNEKSKSLLYEWRKLSQLLHSYFVDRLNIPNLTRKNMMGILCVKFILGLEGISRDIETAKRISQNRC